MADTTQHRQLLASQDVQHCSTKQVTTSVTVVHQEGTIGAASSKKTQALRVF